LQRGHDARHPDPQLVQHLHRLDDQDDCTPFHCVAHRSADFDYDTSKWRSQRPLAIDELLRLVALPAASPRRLDLVGAAADLDVEGLSFFLDQDFDDAVVQRQDIAGSLPDPLQENNVPVAVDVDAEALRRFLQLGLNLALAEP
jgi:hypothetical protein